MKDEVSIIIKRGQLLVKCSSLYVLKLGFKLYGIKNVAVEKVNSFLAINTKCIEKNVHNNYK